MDSLYDLMRRHNLPIPRCIPHLKMANAQASFERVFGEVIAMQGGVYLPQAEYSGVWQWLADNRGTGLCMYGTVGRGKSMIARYVLPALFLERMNKVIRCVHMQDLPQQLNSIVGKSVVILDDVGTEEVHVEYGTRRMLFCEVVERCEMDRKLLIFTTNLDGVALVEKYGSRCVDRIVGMTTRVEFRGKSLRYLSNGERQ